MILDERVEAARRMLRERRVTLEPGPYFADRVIARLRQPEGWVFAWAARRVLSVTLALVAVLMVAIVASGRLPSRARPLSTISSSQHASDPLDWLLEGHEGVR